MQLEPARYEELNSETVELLNTYGFKKYPLDVLSLAEKMGIVIKPYSLLSEEQKTEFENVSKDGFIIAKKRYEVGNVFLCFNPDIDEQRLRQSIAHEIAHVWLEHPSDEEPYETEAEYFGAYLLAPIPLIIAKKLSSVDQIKFAFETSNQAASISLERACNRLRCNKPWYEYEYWFLELAEVEGGDIHKSK